MTEIEEVSGNKEVNIKNAIFVKNSTSTTGLADCIVIAVTKKKAPELRLRCIGAGANNQMIKGIIIAKGKLANKGFNMVINPYFVDIEANGTKSAIEVLLTFNR